jgi:elongation factor Ts
MIDSQTIQKLRANTGAGIMDVKKALEEANGNEEQALEILRKMGQKIAAKKQAEREANEGIIGSYIHANGKVAAMVLLTCETDFVAKTEDFKNLAHDIAMQIAAMNPLYINTSEVPAELIEKEKTFYKEELEKEGKPAEIQEKIIEGKLNKYYEDICLLNQKFIKDDTKTIVDLITDATAKLGEKIEIKKIAKLSVF